MRNSATLCNSGDTHLTPNAVGRKSRYDLMQAGDWPIGVTSCVPRITELEEDLCLRIDVKYSKTGRGRRPGRRREKKNGEGGGPKPNQDHLSIWESAVNNWGVRQSTRRL